MRGSRQHDLFFKLEGIKDFRETDLETGDELAPVLIICVSVRAGVYLCVCVCARARVYTLTLA